MRGAHFARRGNCPARLAVLSAAIHLFWPHASLAFMEDTHLLDLRTGTPLSAGLTSYQNRGYELSDGSWLAFGDWYRPDWPEIQIKFLTMVRRDIGFVWGFGTGESGGQYEIDPSLHLGLIVERELTEAETLSFSVTGIIGGHLSEDACTAGYGSLGGTQRVNCRLAATTMRPADTLNYLFDESPPDRIRVSVRYEFRF